MIYSQPNTAFEAFQKNIATGLVGTLTFRLIDPSDGSTEIAESTVGITEVAAGTYRKQGTAPATADTYLIVWDNGGVETTEELVVTTDAVAVSTPSSGNLTTRAAVREMMQKDAADTAQDAVIDNMIVRASRTIQRYTRIIAPAETATKSFVWRQQGDLSLNPYFLRSASAATVAGSATTAYSLEPSPADDGVYTHLSLDNHETDVSNLQLQDPAFMRALKQTVTVTGDWGYATVPADVQHWATVTVVEWIRKDVSAFSTAFNVDEGRLDRPEEIPAAARQGLRRYKRDDA